MTLGGCTFTDSDGSIATNALANFIDIDGHRAYDYTQMYTMLTGAVTTYTVE